MEDLSTRVTRLRRPRLMVEAARLAEASYRRDRDLPRLVGDSPRKGSALMALLEMEAGCEATRRSNRARYRAGRHVAILSALMAEDRVLRQTVAGSVGTPVTSSDATPDACPIT